MSDEASNEVVAAMEICRSWFESQKISFTGADVVSGASLIIKCRRDRADEVRRQRGDKSNRIGEDKP
jgi:hypothetical protein